MTMSCKIKKIATPKDAAEFARWVEEEAKTDEFLRVLYDLQPAVDTRLVVVPQRRAG
jgi:hypothetical protein